MSAEKADIVFTDFSRSDNENSDQLSVQDIIAQHFSSNGGGGGKINFVTQSEFKTFKEEYRENNSDIKESIKQNTELLQSIREGLVDMNKKTGDNTNEIESVRNEVKSVGLDVNGIDNTLSVTLDGKVSEVKVSFMKWSLGIIIPMVVGFAGIIITLISILT